MSHTGCKYVLSKLEENKVDEKPRKFHTALIEIFDSFREIRGFIRLSELFYKTWLPSQDILMKYYQVC